MNNTGLKPQNDYILCEEVHYNEGTRIVVPDAAKSEKHILRILEDAKGRYAPGTQVLVIGFRSLVWNQRKLALILGEEVVVTICAP